MGDTAYKSSVGSDNINIGGIVNVVDRLIPDETHEIMQWLSPLDPRGRHHDVRTGRLDGVGDWLLETNEFRKWRSSKDEADEAVLFCYGNPGVGKTYLSSLVIDSLCDEHDEDGVAIAMFYCDFRYQEEQTTANIVGAILKQLVTREVVLELVRTAFEKAKGVGGRSLVLPDMVQMLKRSIAKLPRVFICIDALDECLPNHLLALLESLKDTLEVSPRTRIFVTGRPQSEASITRFFTTIVIVPISPKMHDIRMYLERKLEMDFEPDAMSDSLRADILRIIPERMPEIFLLVSLSIDSILAEVTVGERAQKLNELSEGNHVGDAYATTLTRIKAQKGSRPRLGMEALMWVSNSERPLHTSELCHALGVKMGSTDLDVESVHTIRTLLACSLGLITVDSSSDTVSLVHLTLQEYLSSNPDLFQNPHSMMAEVCLTYLNFKYVRELAPTLRRAPSATPLLQYASCYWGDHTRKGMTENVKTLALRLLDGFDKHISAQLILLHYNQYRGRGPYFDGAGGPTGFTGLHGVAFLGIGELVTSVLEMKEWVANKTDCMGSTALIWAAIRGHQEVVRVLLDREDVNPDKADIGCGRAPLSWAAGEGHEGVVKMLLEPEDVHFDQVDAHYGRTPLSWAAEQGHKDVIRVLLEREDVNPDKADTQYGQTPLSWAAEHGHEGVVKMFLGRADVNPDRADTRYHQTPISWAAKHGRERVVRLFLEREDVNPNTMDTNYGQTPLSWASERGHEGIVKMLLEREDVKPDLADNRYGRTPLWWATLCGNEGVIKMLLEREDVTPIRRTQHTAGHHSRASLGAGKRL